MDPVGLVRLSSAASCSCSPAALDTRRGRYFSGTFPRVAFPSGTNYALSSSPPAWGEQQGVGVSSRLRPEAAPRRLSGAFPSHPAAVSQDGMEEGLRNGGGATAHAFLSLAQERFHRVAVVLRAVQERLMRDVVTPGWTVLQEVATTLMGAIDLLRYALLAHAGVELGVAIRWCRRFWVWFLMLRRRRKLRRHHEACEASPALSLLRTLLDDSHSHDAKFAKLQEASDELQDSALCRSRAKDLMVSAGISAAAVSCLMAEAARKGLEPAQVDRVARRLVESTEDTEAALQQAFAAIFMAEPSASLRPEQ